MSLPLAPAPTEPPAGVDYSQVLTGPTQSPARNLAGLACALMGFVLVVPLVAQLFLRAGWWLRGGGDFGDYRTSASAYELPDGIVATQLALATLTVVAALVLWFVHGRRPAWLVSVWPGWRWSYLLICVAVALVVLNGVSWLSFAVIGHPGFHSPQEGWVWYLVAVLLCSPLQAAAEEFFFRGYLLQSIGSAARNPWIGVVGSALLFALFHGSQNVALFAHRFCFGLVMGALVVFVGGLEAGIAAHAVNNVCAFAYALFSGGVAALKATSAITWDRAAFDIGAFALFAVAAWWVGRRLRVPTTTP